MRNVGYICISSDKAGNVSHDYFKVDVTLGQDGCIEKIVIPLDEMPDIAEMEKDLPISASCSIRYINSRTELLADLSLYILIN